MATSSTATIIAAASSPQPQPLFLLLRLRSRARPGARLRAAAARCSSYNGWADLAAEPDLPFPLQPSHALLPLLLLPIAALSLPRLPPLPLLAAAFSAGFATRHLAPSPSPTHSRRLAALLADLDAQLRALSSSSSSTADPSLLLDVANQLRDAARLAAQGTMLGDAVKEAAGYFAAFSSPRKKPKTAAAAALSLETPSPQDDGNGGLLASATNATTKRTQGKPLDSPSASGGTRTGLGDMLPFDMDIHPLDDAGFSAHSKQDDDADDGVERLVSKHRYGRHTDSFQQGRLATESMESPLLERTLEIRDRSYKLKIESCRGNKSQSNEAQQRPSHHTTTSDNIDDESNAVDSDGDEFSHNVIEAAEILRKARECMMARDDEETADALLYKSARLLSTAVALRPSSLVAVGQLGNTYLLHGELKLKVSRELRTLLANTGALLNGRDRVSRSRKLDRRILSRENISSALVDVCEECESLLVEAGRSYRMALSIDSGDVKALYNWGLALTFRAQLLADIGPEAAIDADRVYLAAIDKFDAMLSKSNTYAPEALYRWGIALQQRSYLRSGNNKEKMRLLEQAKSMFEDVLYVEADNKTVREALSSCIAELNYHGRWL
uniref:Uncharacterized protein n=2 Tax=Oryza TaxID=4527 RepID=A0A0E0HVZ5_ORYNI